MKTKYIGWMLWMLGLAFAILGTMNAKKSSDLYVDVVYNVRVSINERMKKKEIEKEDLYFDLQSVQSHLTEQRKMGYVLISALMGIGTILVVKKGKD